MLLGERRGAVGGLGREELGRVGRRALLGELEDDEAAPGARPRRVEQLEVALERAAPAQVGEVAAALAARLEEVAPGPGRLLVRGAEEVDEDDGLLLEALELLDAEDCLLYTSPSPRDRG